MGPQEPPLPPTSLSSPQDLPEAIATAEDVTMMLDNIKISHTVKNAAESTANQKDDLNVLCQGCTPTSIPVARPLPIVVAPSPPQYLSVSIQKPNPNARVGVTMQMDSSKALRIMDIAPQSLLKDLPVAIGDEILSINGISCRNCKSAFACRIIQDAPHVVTIVVKRPFGDDGRVLHVAKVSDTTSTRLGLGLMERGDANVRVNLIKKHGLFQHAMMGVGDLVLSINDVPCTSESQAISCLRQYKYQGEISIVTERTDPSQRPALISATVLKKTPKTKVGLGMQVVEGELRVARLVPFGLFSHSPFRIHDSIVSINHVDCQRCDTARLAFDFMEQLRGSVTVVARVADGNPNLVSTMITKPTPEALVGIVLSSTTGGNIVVTRILEGGLMESSLINVGDRVLSINGVDCHHMSVREATERIRCAERTVTIVAKTNQQVGVAVATNSGSSHTGFEQDVADHLKMAKKLRKRNRRQEEQSQ